MSSRHAAVPCAAALLLAFAFAPARAATVDVQVGGTDTFGYGVLMFNPSSITIHVGDTVRWTNVGGMHSVHANDDSFKCSNSCSSPNNVPSTNPWVATHTFTAAGTVPYHCDQHGTMGMVGQVVVQPATPPPPQPGAFQFSPASYSVSESAGSVTITVSRTGGADGAVAVDYAATAGSASASHDFRAASGTLTWVDQDSAAKSFSVHLVNDGAAEPSETVNLTLSNPTGGATIANAHGTLTILESGPPAPGKPAAPSNLVAAAQSTTDVLLTWKDNSTSPNRATSFLIESKGLTTPYQQIQSAGGTSATVPGLDPATDYFFRIRANNSAGNSAYSNEASAATLAEAVPCVADTHTLCVGAGGRFKLQVAWQSAGGGGMGTAVPVTSAPQSGLFYFVDPSNIEMLIKVLNACVPALGNHYWVFYAATTNVQFTLTVTDTQTGQVKVYFNPLNQAATPVQDTSAFATCP
jgi:plastocyanin